MDGRVQRKEKSRAKILRAFNRLIEARGSHALHVGLRVRVTKQAVAREAGVSSATLYRFPDLVALISSHANGDVQQRQRPALQRRKLLSMIEERDRQIEALLTENHRLMRRLASAGIDPQSEGNKVTKLRRLGH